jgi:hypothetical protein
MKVLLRVCSNISSSFLFHQVSKKRNKLLEQQLEYARLEVNLNMKGKKLALVAQACDLLKKERLALRNFRNELGYKTDDSEAEEMKTSILFYKNSVKDAKCALEEDAVAVSSPVAVTVSSPVPVAVSSPVPVAVSSPVAIDSTSSIVASSTPVSLMSAAAQSPWANI